MTDYARLAAVIAECGDDAELIGILQPVIAAMPKARRSQREAADLFAQLIREA